MRSPPRPRLAMNARVRPSAGSPWLVAGGVLSFIAALLHIAVIGGGGDWYRFFGAGEEMARAAERGSPMPALVTLGIAAVLTVWALFAFSGAGRIARIPLLRTGLVAITAIYLGRGLLLGPLLIGRPDTVDAFALWSSLIVLAYGLTYAVGTARGWRAMSAPVGASARRT